VIYAPLAGKGDCNYCHGVELVKRNSKGDRTTLFNLHCGPPDLQIWGKHSLASPSKIVFSDPAIIVDALVHCIDRTSGREAVHNPEADHRLAKEKEGFENLGVARLNNKQIRDCEWNRKETVRRNKKWLALRSCNMRHDIPKTFDGPGEEEDSEEDSEDSESETEWEVETNGEEQGEPPKRP
jgi:hypothetical protein